MHRVRAAGARFALRSGLPVDDTPFAYLCSEIDIAEESWSGVLLALAEPTEPAPGAGDAAADAIASIVSACAGVTSDDAESILQRSIQAANDTLFVANASRPISRRIHLGLTVVVIHDMHTYIAHMPPGTLFVRQDDSLYKFPQHPDAGAVRSQERAKPLGLSATAHASIYYTRSRAGDTIMALSTELARCVALPEGRHAASSSVVGTLERLLDDCDRQFVATGHGVIAVIPEHVESTSASPTLDINSYVSDARHSGDGVSDRHGDTTSRDVVLDRFSDTDPLDPVALAVQTDRAHERASDGVVRYRPQQHDDMLRLEPDRPHRVANSAIPSFTAIRITNTPGSRAHGATGYDSNVLKRFGASDEVIGFSVDDGAFDAYGSHARMREHGNASGGAGLSRSSRPNLRGNRLVELLAGLILSLTAAVVGAWQVTKRDRPLHGPLDDGSFGLPRLQRWDEGYRPPRMQRVRSRLPRLEASRIVVLFAIVLLVALAGGYYVSRSNSQELQQTAETLTLLEQAEARRVTAATMSDPGEAYQALLAVESSLVAATPADPADAERLASLRSLVSADIARVTQSYRLSSVQVVGGVPAAPRGISARLVSGGGNLYLLSDGVYKVDTFSSTLVQLLISGDIVDGAEVGALHGATWREDRLLAVDATRSYAFDVTRGGWVSEELSTLDAAGFSDVAAVATFDRNLYMVTPESGQILKFQAGAYDGPAEDWTAGVANAELQRAVDMAIDGHVLVLLDDGTILDFFRSRLEATITPQVTPALERAAAIAAPVGSPYIYVLHETDGRIVRLTRDGEVVQQFTTPVSGAAPILSGATDLAIDEATGVAYILARNTVYTVRLPAPPE
jgi:hypothetical protein